MQPHYRDPLPLGDPAGLPYSKGMMARALVSAGVGIVSAYEIATRLELELLATGARATELERLEQTAADVLGELEAERVVRRLRRLAALEALDKPILLLVGGATGTGKSTVATESAHRLGITRVTSTDFIRQTIRAYFPPSEMPAVHASSFETGGVEGFLEQSRQVLVGVEASIERAMTEGWSMAIEGVHLVPGMVPTEVEGALLVHAVMYVSSIDEHRSHFVIRDSRDGRHPFARQVHRRPRRDPGAPGVDRRARRRARGSHHREHRPRARHRRAARPGRRGLRTTRRTAVKLYPRPMPSREAVIEALHQVEDPELGMDIVDLGLLYDVEVEGPNVKVSYTLTSMGCPAGAMIQEDIDRVVSELEGVDDVHSELTFDPPWTPERMSEDAKFILGF